MKFPWRMYRCEIPRLIESAMPGLLCLCHIGVRNSSANNKILMVFHSQAAVRRKQEIIANTHSNRPNGPTRAEQGRKRWGKKERKMRDDNPYGGNDIGIGLGETTTTPHQRRAGDRKKANRKAAKHEARRQNNLYST